MQENATDYNALFNEANQFLQNGDYSQAEECYLTLTHQAAYAPVSFYQLAKIQNIKGKTLNAKTLYYKALNLCRDLCKYVFVATHLHHGYIFHGLLPEKAQEACPLCGGGGAILVLFSPRNDQLQPAV